MRPPLLLLVLPLLACKDYEALCKADDPSVDAATCWRQGWNRAWNTGYGEGYDLGWEEGYATCEEDHWYGW